MFQNQTNVLAVSPGRHRIGVAVFRNGYLCYYRGKSLRQFRNEKSLQNAVEKFLANLVTRYGINYLTVQSLIRQQETSPLLIAVAELVKRFAEIEGIKLHEYSPFFVRQSFCRMQPPTQENAARNIAKQYPELERYLSRTKDWERRYYRYIFNAIAVGAVCSQELKDYQNV